MTNEFAVSVPLERVRRVQIYINSPRKTVAQIKAATGADYILNGTLYDMTTGKVNCHLKVNGKVLANPPYNVYGYAWDTGGDIAMTVLPAKDKQNYIACTPLTIKGEMVYKPTYDKAQGGKRGRSAIGMKNGKLCLYCSRDGSSAARTPESLRDMLWSYGWTSAVMLDGGGSSQCDFSGDKITSSRKVQHLILIYINDNEPRGEKPMVTINAYSKVKDGSKKLSTNFTVKEFACKDGSDTILVAPDLVKVLQAIRSHFNAPVTLLSPYRTPQYNEKVGGVAQSQHCYGTAADISVKGHTPAEVAAFARQIMPDWGGVGIYKKQGFTHVDVREVKADWEG